MRRSPQVAEVLPLLYLRGLSTGDFREALPVLLGEDAAGLSATNITRLTAAWDEEYQAFRRRDLSECDFIYVWVDGIHFNIRLEEDRLCTLVMLGVRSDGTKELVALEDGYRESAESWSSVLRDLRRRGLRAPVMAVGDGALGFWSAVRDAWPETTPQRDWVPQVGQRARQAAQAPSAAGEKGAARGHVCGDAGRRRDGHRCLRCRVSRRSIRRRPAAWWRTRRRCWRSSRCRPRNWVHLRTSNLIESPFATVRLRQRVTKGAGSRTKGLLMAYKLLEMAQRRWRSTERGAAAPLGACWGPVRRWRASRSGPDGNGDSEGSCLTHVKAGSTTFDNSSRHAGARGAGNSLGQ